MRFQEHLLAWSARKAPRKSKKGSSRTQRTGALALESLELRDVPSTVYETGPNESLWQNTALVLTESPTNYLSGLGVGSLTTKDVDYWKFTAQAGDRVSIAGDGGLNANSVRIELRNSSDGVLASATDNAGHAQIGNFLIPKTGTYLIRATTRDGGTNTLNSYSVRADIARGFMTESESNGTVASADALALTRTGNRSIGLIAGNVSSASDQDYFDLGAQPAGAVVSLSVVKPADSMLDPRVELRNSAGAVLATTTGTGDIHFRVPSAGRYYAVVAADTGMSMGMSMGTGGAGNQGTYVLSADVGTAVSMTVKSGLWSDPSVWDVVPTKDRDVLILNDVVIDNGAARRVDILGGTTTLAGTLNAYGSVVVESTLVGTQGALLFHVANDRTFVGNTVAGPNPMMMDDHADTDIGLWGMGGSTVKLVGSAVTPWLDAMPTGTTGASLGYGGVALPTIGSTSATLSAAPVGWQVGDTLLLTAVDGSSTLATLRSVNGRTVTYQLTGATTFSAPTVFVEGQYARPKVANLSRRLVIAGADVKEGDTNHRAHTVFMHSHVELDNVEFRNLGPTGKLGRYPVHFHDVESGMDGMGGMDGMEGMDDHVMQELVGSSIWQSVSEGGNRFVTLHGTEGATVANNVAFRSTGHGFFMESGTEIGNTVTGNLSVAVGGAETLPVTDSELAPGAHHYWLRAGNMIAGNVAVGGDANSVGMVMLQDRNPNMPNLPAVATDNQFLGIGKYGVWARGTPAEYVRTLSIYAGQSGVGDASYPDYSPITLTDPVLLYNGTNPGISWASQIFMNQAQNVAVRGGVMVGALAVHVHYTTTFTVEGTKIRAGTLMDPTYWELTGVYRNVDLQVGTLFKSTYPARRQSPGLLRIEGAVGSVGGKGYTVGAPLTADFTAAAAVNVTGFTGTSVSNAARQLTASAPVSGFIRVPTSAPRYSSTWSVVPAGTKPGAFTSVSESEDAWKKATAGSGLGYDGFPPGTYDVVIKTQDGRTLTYKNVVVRSGAVTDLSTYATTTATSSELSWATGFTPVAAAGGGYTIKRTYQIQGAAPTANFTISYYSSTDPWGKSNVTLLGTETVNAAANKTLGTHTGTSPVLSIKQKGLVYLFAKIDTGNTIAENIEDNNTSAMVPWVSL